MFTKVYKEEDVRLRGCSYNVASVYFHLKNKRDYFKSKNNGTCYDLTKYISEYTGIPQITIKRAIATLKNIGLISTVIKGKVNHYSFPILDVIENNIPIEEVIKDNPSKTEEKQIEPKPYMEQNIENENKTNLNTQIIQDDNQCQEEVESGLNSLKMDNNEIIEDNTYMEEKPVVKIAANNKKSVVERVQELINTDDDFYTAYSRYIKSSIDYINEPTGRCSANSKEMAKVRLETELDKHHINFNKDIMEMINRDINETIKIRNIDVA